VTTKKIKSALLRKTVEEVTITSELYDDYMRVDVRRGNIMLCSIALARDQEKHFAAACDELVLKGYLAPELMITSLDTYFRSIPVEEKNYNAQHPVIGELPHDTEVTIHTKNGDYISTTRTYGVPWKNTNGVWVVVVSDGSTVKIENLAKVRKQS
jgi:hypothetical protein